MKKDKYLYRIDEIVDNYRNGLASIYELANIFRIQLDANRIQDYKVLECNAKRLEILDEKNNVIYTSVVVKGCSTDIEVKSKRSILLVITKSDDSVIERFYSLSGKLLLEKMDISYGDNELHIERSFSHLDDIVREFKIVYGAYYRDLIGKLNIKPCLTQHLQKEIKEGLVQSVTYHMHAHDYFSDSDEVNISFSTSVDNLVYHFNPIRYANNCYLWGTCIRNTQHLGEISVLNFNGYKSNSNIKHILKIVKRNYMFEISYTIDNQNLTECENRQINFPGISVDFIKSEELASLINFLEMNGDNDFIEAVIRELNLYKDKLHAFELGIDKEVSNDPTFNIFSNSNLEEIEGMIRQNKEGLFDSFENKFQEATHLPAIGEDGTRKRKKKE